jgi:hypothetical protein
MFDARTEIASDPAPAIRAAKGVYLKCNLVYSGRYWRKRMKIASYNLGRGKALNIGAAYLAYQASVFTGFSSFLLSRGSMAAPTAK